ncbi:hypothetical protein TVAG_388040 [Trichomonas vaginalis G3]|uniref:Uncharacterized protein n=1 Tax=Trichomonas vaginalis (strain ATCC PRA-98 / G3) TaxID=412133 RepID=A2E131_TRIV3|nr:hypothetical protein TVAGG3_0330940 [Trichomonas vaginalis G3]XP_051100154.1 hypothetical protein TVAGG3_0330710 [Trichomonas vaginalis G3]EAY13663.1 hypothetical protein TVAG_388040 [Trichomonas vaginalis G3]KAI5529937.1 hypothetical protein TVAGG3_0330710 [Trichomonas vaginalis G3]KAI5529956.1 hypothetical protein TVAGG3_0330940 [Trichomonas vaginalis G3]|eukprot:XP_001325886.1 hypothetical protein [Trichomonas vaginalis G3]
MRVIHASKTIPKKNPIVVERQVTIVEPSKPQQKPLSPNQQRLMSEPIDFLSMEMKDDREVPSIFDDEKLNEPLGHLAVNINPKSSNYSLTNLKTMIDELKVKPRKNKSMFRLANSVQSKPQHRFTAEDAAGLICVERVLHSESESKEYTRSTIRNYPDSLLNLPGNRAKNARASLPLTFA